MKRFHVHLGVNDLDDPRLNFAISRRGNAPGVNHLGLQVESDDELKAVRGQFAAADTATIIDEPNVSCCYANSDKHWVTDPQGIAWEAFHTLRTIPLFGAEGAQSASSAACCSTAAAEPAAASACCAPAAAPPASACCASTTRAVAACCS